MSRPNLPRHRSPAGLAPGGIGPGALTSLHVRFTLPEAGPSGELVRFADYGPDRTTNSVTGGVRTRFVTNGRTWAGSRFLGADNQSHSLMRLSDGVRISLEKILAASWTNGRAATSRSLSRVSKRPTLGLDPLRLPCILQNPLAQFQRAAATFQELNKKKGSKQNAKTNAKTGQND